MLVITRRVGETIWIGPDISVTVLDEKSHCGQQVRIGIQAPREIQILREELLESDDHRIAD